MNVSVTGCDLLCQQWWLKSPPTIWTQFGFSSYCFCNKFWIVSRCQAQGGVVRPIDFMYVEILVANVVGPGDGGKR